MRRRTLVLLLAAPGGALAQPAPRGRPMHEMRGGCDNFGLDMRREFALFAGPAREVPAFAGPPGPEAPALRPDVLAEVPLLGFGAYRPVVAPAQNRSAEGRFGGNIAVELPGPGRWRVSAGPGGSWYDLVDTAGATLHDPWFEMQTGCATPFKTVVFQAMAAGRFTLSLNGNRTQRLRLLVTADG